MRSGKGLPAAHRPHTIVDKLQVCNWLTSVHGMRRLVGQNVRRMRQKRGLTQEQFAEISGFSQQYLSGLEKGKRNPTIVTVFELATALGVSHIDLLRPRKKPAQRQD
jgi:DNA-binding XRE family transcriptional regulator